LGDMEAEAPAPPPRAARGESERPAASGARRASERPSISPRAVEVSDEQLVAALRAHGWSPGRTAASLGLPTGTLHDLMRRSGHVRRAADVGDDELRETYDACAGDTRSMAEKLCVSERGLRITLRQRGLLED